MNLYKRILAYVRPYLRVLALALVCTVLAAAGNLYLVGDPKQSIYSFQGADVRTYLQACRDLEAAGARRFPLRRNWRSTSTAATTKRILTTSGTWPIYMVCSSTLRPCRCLAWPGRRQRRRARVPAVHVRSRPNCQPPLKPL